ncbi:hypothetical protein L1987_26234 [Smallanthus sonchifolius]|uniref:Uncharacterized protein n=1 Tax=Smallanthus sonchifolius TaxID=185202 RepID=A0ACB9IAP7_9ASTR|nr:hypothetical protein L1987_26234 [Smallanthus sonchifolius]
MMIFTFTCFVSYKWFECGFHFDAWLMWICWEDHGPPQQHHRVQVVDGPLWLMAHGCRGTGCLMLGPGLLRTTSLLWWSHRLQVISGPIYGYQGTIDSRTLSGRFFGIQNFKTEFEIESFYLIPT